MAKEKIAPTGGSSTAPPKAALETNRAAADRVEDLARELFAVRVLGRSLVPEKIAEDCFADAAAFYAVADRRRTPDQKRP